MFTLAQLYCKNILPPVLCNYKIFLDCVSLQSLSPLPRVSWHGAAAAFGSQELSARAGSKMAAKRPPEMSPSGPASPRAKANPATRVGPTLCLKGSQKVYFPHKYELVPQHFFFSFSKLFEKLTTKQYWNTS